LPSHYIGQAALGPTQGVLTAELATWWLEFNDPLLTQFLSAALEQNLDLAQAAARVTQARAGLSAANAALVPSGVITGSAARARSRRGKTCWRKSVCWTERDWPPNIRCGRRKVHWRWCRRLFRLSRPASMPR